MNRIQTLQARIGATPDGFWGPQSIQKAQSHLRRLMPSRVPWPDSSDKSLRAFYGNPGDEDNLVSIPLGGEWTVGDKVATKTRCHRKVADSLTRIFAELVRQKWNKVLTYDGCFNDRNMRNGIRKSTHAWGISVDLGAGNNGNLTPWPVKATMPIEVMEIFAKEGWLSAGAWWGRDGMHHQCTK